MKRLLLLSNSTMSGEPFLLWPQAYIQQFLGDIKDGLLFIPYAGVAVSWDEYASLAAGAFAEMGIKMTSIHEEDDQVKAVQQAKSIVVGGGNTFSLYKEVQENGLMAPIRKRVEEGVPYIGWSAGSNLACPGLYTSNDMPIVQPPSFDGLNLIGYQINPHYTDKKIEGHGGETRDQRLSEFMVLNEVVPVVGLREASFILVEGEKHFVKGHHSAKFFKMKEWEEIELDQEFSNML